MAYVTKKKTETNKKYFELGLYEATVKNVRVVTDTLVSFTLSCAGFALYNMKLCCTADGREFVAPPATKGKDGKYYDQYAIYLSQDDQQKIIEKVKEFLDESN